MTEEELLFVEEYLEKQIECEYCGDMQLKTICSECENMSFFERKLIKNLTILNKNIEIIKEVI